MILSKIIERNKCEIIMGKFDFIKKEEISKKKNLNINDELEEEAVLGSVNVSKETLKPKHPGGRPKKNLVLKKTELRIKPDVYYNLSILAEIDGRSTNNYICQILESITQDEGNKDKIINYLRERGEK